MTFPAAAVAELDSRNASVMADQLTGRDVWGAGAYSAARAAVCWCDGSVRWVQRCGAVPWPEGPFCSLGVAQTGSRHFKFLGNGSDPAHPAGIDGRTTRQQQGGPDDRCPDPCRPGWRTAPVCWRCRALLLRTRGSACDRNPRLSRISMVFGCAWRLAGSLADTGAESILHVQRSRSPSLRRRSPCLTRTEMAPSPPRSWEL